jgi:hypothetical protein
MGGRRGLYTGSAFMARISHPCHATRSKPRFPLYALLHPASPDPTSRENRYSANSSHEKRLDNTGAWVVRFPKTCYYPNEPESFLPLPLAAV